MITFRERELDLVTLDFETYWAKDYTLSMLPTSEYVRDSRFKAQLLGIKINDGPTELYATKQIRSALKAIDWKRSGVLAHHTAFDAFILTQRFGVKPAAYFDTLSMARAALGHGVRHGLHSVGQALGLGGKIEAASLYETRGIADYSLLPPNTLRNIHTYCRRDVDLCHDAFWKLYDYIPDNELELIDLTLRMFVEPKLEIDLALATEEYEEAVASKMRLLLLTGMRREDLNSAPKFAEALKQLNVVPQMKMSPTTHKPTYAFAKTDDFMQDLLQHPDPQVVTLAEARLSVRSSIGETRAQRFMSAAKHGTMPVYLNYYGAHTGRWSGGDKMNLQNLPRARQLADGSPDPTSARLRRALRAPKGSAIVVADSGQIEARVNAWLAGQQDVLKVFRLYDAKQGPDMYKVMASRIFGVAIELVTKAQRQIGKICCLALGYGMGAEKLQHTLGLAGIDVDLVEATRYVRIYRQANNYIERSWTRYNNLLPRMMLKTCDIPLGPLTLKHEAVQLPNGLFIRYPELRVIQGEASFAGRHARTKLYGGILCENFVQALARCIIAEQKLTLHRMGHRIVTSTHDEIVVLARKTQADKVLAKMFEVMTTPPAWAPDLPLAADGGWAENYAK